MTVHLPFLAFIVVLLIAFIIGWVVGASFGKSGNSKEEKKIDFNKPEFEEKLWKQPNSEEIDWGKVIRDSEKRSKDKWK